MSKRHVLGALHQGDYYVRLLDRSGRIVGLFGFQPEGLPLTSVEGKWQTLKDTEDNRYHQISYHCTLRIIALGDTCKWGDRSKTSMTTSLM